MSTKYQRSFSYTFTQPHCLVLFSERISKYISGSLAVRLNHTSFRKTVLNFYVTEQHSHKPNMNLHLQVSNKLHNLICINVKVGDKHRSSMCAFFITLIDVILYISTFYLGLRHSVSCY